MDAYRTWSVRVWLGAGAVAGFRPVDFLPEKLEYTLGRNKDCDVRVADIHVSSHHCKISKSGDVVSIVDTR